jgi:hypothetical protein
MPFSAKPVLIALPIATRRFGMHRFTHRNSGGNCASVISQVF